MHRYLRTTVLIAILLVVSSLGLAVRVTNANTPVQTDTQVTLPEIGGATAICGNMTINVHFVYNETLPVSDADVVVPVAGCSNDLSQVVVSGLCGTTSFSFLGQVGSTSTKSTYEPTVTCWPSRHDIVPGLTPHTVAASCNGATYTALVQERPLLLGGTSQVASVTQLGPTCPGA